MNQDQVKQLLLNLHSEVEEFRVIFTGKQSKKVDGLYHPESKEILIHNRNLTSDNELIYTAIHEFAHHIQFTTSLTPISSRTHTLDFWSIFHSLLLQAEKSGFYNNIFNHNVEFKELTRKIKDEIFSADGRLMKRLGVLLLEARQLCQRYHTSFEDYLDRVLNLSRSSASAVVKAQALNLNPKLGFENMKTLVRIPDHRQRAQAEAALLEGCSSSLIKSNYLKPLQGGTPGKGGPRQLEFLKTERSRVQRQIQRLTTKLTEIEERISSYEINGSKR